MNKKLRIRNSTAEFLMFASRNEGNSIEVRFEEDTLWLTQQLIAELFQTTVPNISMHIKGIYADGELDETATLKNFLTVRQEGSRQVNRSLDYYNLDMIIADVLAKKIRGVQYCRTASAWGKANGYKEWKYLFIPSKQIAPQSTFEVLSSRFAENDLKN